MTVASKSRPTAETETARPTSTPEPMLQERIDTMIAEAVKRQPPPLSPEEQRKKNQAALDMLHEWDEEDKTNDPEGIARRQAEWEEFKGGMNENNASNRVLLPRLT